jgi:hypothetical protein
MPSNVTFVPGYALVNSAAYCFIVPSVIRSVRCVRTLIEPVTLPPRPPPLEPEPPLEQAVSPARTTSAPKPATARRIFMLSPLDRH